MTHPVSTTAPSKFFTTTAEVIDYLDGLARLPSSDKSDWDDEEFSKVCFYVDHL